MAYIFLGFGSLPYFETINPNIILENTIKAHVSVFILIPNSLHLWKHSLQEHIQINAHIIIDSEIILKDHEFVQIIFKGFIHYPLISRRSIFHSKRHHNPSKGSLIYYKGCQLLSILYSLFLYIYMVISKIFI